MTAPLSHQDDGRVRSEVVAPEKPVRQPPAQRSPWALTRARAAGIGRLARRAQITSPVLQGLLALVIYLAAWLTTRALPLVQDPARPQLNQLSMDPNFFTWNLRWWPHAISHGLNPLYTSEIGAPAGHLLAWVTTIPPLALAAWPLTAAAGPIVSFNLLAAIALPVSGWAAFVLCRRITRRFWPALAGGAVYGFSAYEMNHGFAGQLNLTFSLLLPLMAYVVLLWRDQKISSRTLVGLLAVAMALQFYLFLETFADMTMIWVAALLLGYALAGPGRPVVARLSRLASLAYLLALVLASPYLVAALAHVPPNFIHLTGVDLASLVVPRPGHTLQLSWLAQLARGPSPTSAEGYVGIPLLAITAALAVLTWSSRLTRFLTGMLVIVVLAAFGPFLYIDGHRIVELPWARIWYLPIARSAFPARFMVFAFLILAVLTAQWLAGPSRPAWARWARWPLAALAIAAIVLDTPTLPVLGQSDLPAFIASGQYHRNLARGETVAVVSTHGNAGLLWQADTDFYLRLTGGYISSVLTTRTDLPKAIQDLAHPTPLYVRQFEMFVRQARIGAILIDMQAAPKWVGIFNRIGLRGEVIGGVNVYPTDRCRGCHAAVPPPPRPAPVNTP